MQKGKEDDRTGEGQESRRKRVESERKTGAYDLFAKGIMDLQVREEHGGVMRRDCINIYENLCGGGTVKYGKRLNKDGGRV